MRCLIAATLLLGGSAAVLAQARMPAAPRPKITLAAPLGIAPGTTTRVVLRGLELDRAAEVRCPTPQAAVKLLRKGKAAVPNGQEAKRIGDSEVEIEIRLPKQVAGDTVALTVKSPAGESSPYSLFVERAGLVREQEPNNGFARAQPLTLPAVVHGAIDHGWDVDVFRFEGKAGQKLIVEVHAARHGSLLDSIVTLYDAGHSILATSDDHEGSTDSRLEFTLPRTGTYYLTLLDANDQNNPLHVYRLTALEVTVNPRK